MKSDNDYLNQVLNHITFTKVENYRIDEIFPTLKGSDIKILLHIIRNTVGFNRVSFMTNYANIANKTGVDYTYIKPCLERLVNLKLIVIEKVNFRQIKIIFDRRVVKLNQLSKP